MALLHWKTQELSILDHPQCKSIAFGQLPQYLQTQFNKIIPEPEQGHIPLLSLQQIREIQPKTSDACPQTQTQYAHLLLLRDHLTRSMCSLSESCEVPFGVSPELILERAKVYEALAYADLALADAYVAFSVANEDEEDLTAVSADGKSWQGEGEEDADDDTGSDGAQTGDSTDGTPDAHLVRLTIKRDALRIMVRSLKQLGCFGELSTWNYFLEEAEVHIQNFPGYVDEKDQANGWSLHGVDPLTGPHDMRDDDDSDGEAESVSGLCRRETYPWNSCEPSDRTSDASLREINKRLFKLSDGRLEARKTMLPNLKSSNDASDNGPSISTQTENAQLGLFALRDLAPNETILREHSVLTAIRPHDAPFCDACAGDLPEALQDQSKYTCPGCSIPFCSEHCLSTAISSYHIPNFDSQSTELGYPPSASPFCPGSIAHADIHDIGRAEASTEPEWDLYFLLIARCIMMAETQRIHPLDLIEVKSLWGDFNSVPTPSNHSQRHSSPEPLKQTLPFSFTYSLLYPYHLFTTLLSSRPESHPYSTQWLHNYDFWIIQTLYAKFRSVADARQSTWDGKPEVAGVFGLWCLGNHSCAANVTWGSGGTREYTVREEEVMWMREDEEEAEDVGKGNDDIESHNQNGDEDDTGERNENRQNPPTTESQVSSIQQNLQTTTINEPSSWTGIKASQEIWNHYTDVMEPDFRIRRARLREVLGGECMCERCVFEAKEFERKNAGDENGDGREV